MAAALSTCVSKTISMEGMSRKEASHRVASGPRPARWVCHPLRRDLALLNRHPTMPGLITIPLSYFIGTSPRNNGALSTKSVLLRRENTLKPTPDINVPRSTDEGLVILARTIFHRVACSAAFRVSSISAPQCEPAYICLQRNELVIYI
jgi:hypothetical protein